MNVYAKLIIIFEVFGICEPYINQPNVGSVLFSTTDLHKNRWTKSELGSLRARRYFQGLIPSPKLKDSLNDEYVLHLISYVQNCYNTVISEAETPAEHLVMANALSDVIGGYLKVWVLPITKYAYYGGTISPDNAIKLFQMYEDIKFSLKTDGQSWHSPNDDLLQSVTINIAPNPHDWYTRSIHDTCDDLAYYEKTDNGLTIPLPYINWDLNPQTMFIPLKNQSLVQLDSLNSSNALLDYYNIASSCVHSLNMGSIDDFGSRFQIWLSSDVVPHLKDDNLYIAFGSVLSILNKTKSFYKDVVNLCDSAYLKLQSKALCAGSPIRFTKKALIIALIIFIELVWCIPVLYYILCVKRPKKKKHILNQFFKSFKRDPRTKSTNKDPLHGVKLFVKPRTRNLELDVEFPTYSHKYYMKSTSTNVSRDNIFENVTHINESMKRLSTKQFVSDNNKPIKTERKTSNQNICNNFASKNNCNTMSSLTDNSAKTITLIEESEIKNLSYTHATLSVSKSVSNNKLCLEVASPDKIACTACNNNKPETIPDVNKKPKKCLFRSENKRKTSPVSMKMMKPNKGNKVEYKTNSKERPSLPLKTIKPETTTKKRPVVANVIDTNKNNEFKKSKGSIDHTKIIAKENIPKTSTTVPKKKFVLSEIMTTCTSKINEKPEDSKTTNKKDVSRIKISSIENQSNPVETNKHADEQRTSIEKNILENKIKTTQNKLAFPEVAKANKSSLNERSKLGKKEPTKKSTIVKSMSIKNDLEKGKPQEQPIMTNITIDSPRREIEIGIKSSVKPSKIPRRIFTAPINDSAGKGTSPAKKENTSPRTLFRAQKKTLDDSAIKKTVNKTTKLNTTL